MTNVEEISTAITSFLHSRPGPATGAQISATVSRQFPGISYLDYGCEKLKDFIARHVPGLKAVGRAGGDIVYALASTQSSVLQPQPTKQSADLEAAVLRLFSSPDAPYALYANAEARQLIILLRVETAPGHPWTFVPPLAKQMHENIARDFAGTIEDETKRSYLTEVIGTPRWWLAYWSRAAQSGVQADYRSFRHTRLREALEGTLKNLGFVDTEYTVTASPGAAPSISAPTSPSRAIRPASHDRAETPELRGIAARFLEHMSATEIREMRVPVGAVLDAIQSLLHK
jgi:hypothetical protein